MLHKPTPMTLESVQIGRDRWAVPSRSQPGSLHVITLVAGRFSCTCDGCLYRGHCAHIASVQGSIGLLPVDPDKLAAARAIGIMT